MKIYVGNLAYQTSDDAIRAAFEQFGSVESAVVIMDRETGRSKGFGFVEMPNAEEAQKAIENMNETEVDGRSLRVNEARAPQPRAGGSRGGRFGGGDRKPRRY